MCSALCLGYFLIAVAYFFAIKNRAGGVATSKVTGGNIIPFGNSEKKEVETDETLQLKELIGKYQKALQYYKQAMGIHREVGDKLLEGVVLGNIATTYNYLDNRQSILRQHVCFHH